jgi:hypothetical protein
MRASWLTCSNSTHPIILSKYDNLIITTYKNNHIQHYNIQYNNNNNNNNNPHQPEVAASSAGDGRGPFGKS